MYENTIQYNLMFEKKSIHSAKILVGHIYIYFSGTTFIKWGTNMPLPITWPLLGLRKFWNCMK